MKPLAIGISLLFVGAASWLLLSQEPSSTPHSAEVPAAKSATTSSLSDSAAAMSRSATEPAVVTNLRERVVTMTNSLDSVTAERKRAEAALQQAERDVTALEQYIEDIKARGEDPADYAEEGLAIFQPAFHAYQNAFDTLELTETLEKTAAEDLAAAEEELANTLLEKDTGQ